MQRLEVSGAVRLIYGSLGVKGLNRAHVISVCLYVFPCHFINQRTVTSRHTKFSAKMYRNYAQKKMFQNFLSCFISKKKKTPFYV